MTTTDRRCTTWGASGAPEPARGPARAAWEALTDQLLPSVCAVCRAPAAEALCPACLSACPAPRAPRCGRCGGERVGGRRACPRCAGFGRSFAFARAAAPWRYAGPVRRLVHAFKYHGARDVLAGLGRRMARTPTLHPGRGPRLVACVPPSPGWRRRRGYNQAEELARGLCAERGWPLAAHALARRRAGPRQVGAGRARRRRQARAAFRASPALVGGQRVLLVDDVLSTGATADACARALLVAGAERVDVVTLAT